MDDLSELLTGSERVSSPPFGTVLALIAVALAAGLLAYLLWCYLRERQIRKHIKQRVHRRYGGNIVPPVMLSETKRLHRKSSRTLPLPHRSESNIKLRRRSRGPHPWKQDRFRHDSATPH